MIQLVSIGHDIIPQVKVKYKEFIMRRCPGVKQGTKIVQGALVDYLIYKMYEGDFRERYFVGFENSQNYSNFSNIPKGRKAYFSESKFF